jgi:hypothetical protein
MAGVAGPMLRRSPAHGARFLGGLAAGGAAGGAVLAVPVYLIGRLLGPLPLSVRVFGLVLVGLVLAVADLRQRTPHVWRQVPQSLWSRLSPGSLGLTWGFDLGLLFTTQKTTSLIWMALAALVLLQPSLAGVALIGISVLAVLAVAIASVGGGAERRVDPKWSTKWVTHVRWGSGALLLVATAATASLTVG